MQIKCVFLWFENGADAAAMFRLLTELKIHELLYTEIFWWFDLRPQRGLPIEVATRSLLLSVIEQMIHCNLECLLHETHVLVERGFPRRNPKPVSFAVAKLWQSVEFAWNNVHSKGSPGERRFGWWTNPPDRILKNSIFHYREQIDFLICCLL